MIQNNQEAETQIKKVINIRQADDDTSYENGNFKYKNIVNRSDSEIDIVQETDKFLKSNMPSDFLNPRKKFF